MSELTVGIDLGTTNSLIGAVRDGQAVLFADDRDEHLLPSAVGVDGEGRIVVGRPARNRRLLDPGRTVVSVKRSMGRDVRLRVGAKELTPPQISALIVGALLDRAEAALGSRPARAIITVPAYFDDAQRQATRDAGELAGVEVERLVNEPTAAALTYQSGGEELVAVYDLGGGTFDVSILERDEGMLEVTASHGDTQLGGDDIDQALYRWALERLGDDGARIDADALAKTRLLEAMERAKIALSDRDEVRIYDAFIHGGADRPVSLDLLLTRAELGVVARPFIERTLTSIDEALRAAGVRARDLDRVVLVGGGSKMALVRELVSTHLDLPAHTELDADRAVALGASLLAGRSMGLDVADVLVDITPHTLGAGVLDDPDDVDLVSSPIIRRGMVVPVEQQRTYATMVEDQETVHVPIAQGESQRLEDNTPLGDVIISGLPPSPANSPVEITFRLDLSGVLHVRGVHVPSGKAAEVRIANSPYRLTAKGRETARAEVEALRAGMADESLEASPVGEAELALARAMLARAARALEARDDDSAETTAASSARAALAAAVETGDPRTGELTEALSDALLDLL